MIVRGMVFFSFPRLNTGYFDANFTNDHELNRLVGRCSGRAGRRLQPNRSNHDSRWLYLTTFFTSPRGGQQTARPTITAVLVQ
jgi:hypothetical protein